MSKFSPKLPGIEKTEKANKKDKGQPNIFTLKSSFHRDFFQQVSAAILVWKAKARRKNDEF
jgi:hypothetical protein